MASCSVYGMTCRGVHAYSIMYVCLWPKIESGHLYSPQELMEGWITKFSRAVWYGRLLTAPLLGAAALDKRNYHKNEQQQHIPLQ